MKPNGFILLVTYNNQPHNVMVFGPFESLNEAENFEPYDSDQATDLAIRFLWKREEA